jgi:ketosteroid isomerase-like protein
MGMIGIVGTMGGVSTMTERRDAVLAANQAFYRAFEKRDMAAMGQIWSKGIGTLCIHPGRPALIGWEAVRSSWEAILKNTAYIEIEPEILSVEINGDLAYVVLIENLRQVIGLRQDRAQSMATNLFERMGGEWFLVHHHGSPLMR